MRRRRWAGIGFLFLTIAFFLLVESKAALPYIESRLATTAIPTITLSPPPKSSPTASPTTPRPTPPPTSVPTATPIPPTEPVYLNIPAIALEAPIEPVHWMTKTTATGVTWVWQVPNHRAVGWHDTSACLGAGGNTVLNGHNYGYGEVFRNLYKLRIGDLISVTGANGFTYTYRIVERYLLEEGNQPLSVRQQNASLAAETTDERLTLITCHPYGSTRYRLVIVARPQEIIRP